MAHEDLFLFIPKRWIGVNIFMFITNRRSYSLVSQDERIGMAVSGGRNEETGDDRA